MRIVCAGLIRLFYHSWMERREGGRGEVTALGCGVKAEGAAAMWVEMCWMPNRVKFTLFDENSTSYRSTTTLWWQGLRQGKNTDRCKPHGSRFKTRVVQELRTISRGKAVRKESLMCWPRFGCSLEPEEEGGGGGGGQRRLGVKKKSQSGMQMCWISRQPRTNSYGRCVDKV